MKSLYLIVPLAPLAGALIAGLLGKIIGRTASHVVTIAGMVVSVIAAFLVFQDVLAGNTFNGPLYTWITNGDLSLQVGFLIDKLSATMMVVVTFVSLMVHIYTIGYMADDPGYQRFFSYISLFTFSMLMLVMSNNFLQLFFGWEAVGLVSYLLIGFWYTRPTAIYANLKAFMVNRVGDLGFLLGIALVLVYFGTLDYAQVFAKAPAMADKTVEAVAFVQWPLITTICILLFIGAMGKSAQFPLHVWLPDSMEGPTPISALIHAATMVTAGIFMVARMSHLFELSETALSFVMVIGGITALFMALVAIVQTDIKRVVAYSTLSQLGYMTVALGASAYAAGMFHLVTHAFFKALLFLGAGSVIIAMHHEQDMTKMGGLRKYMPITYATMMIGALASAGIPGFAGFFSKDAIIEAVQLSHVPGSGFAYFCVLSCVFVTAFYTFRLMFMTFHGKERFASHAHDEHAHDDHHGHDEHGHGHAPHETPAVVTGPLIVLAIPSVCAGWWIGSILYGDYFGKAIEVAEAHDVIGEMGKEFHGVVAMMVHALGTLPFWLSIAGIAAAAFLYLKRTDLPAKIASAFGPITTLLENKYYFDRFNDWFFAGGARGLGRGLWKVGDVAIIDGFLVNGSAKVVAWFAVVARKLQSGLIYHYAFTMIIGVFVLLTIWFARS
ncbi:MAG TPA: NADH-quinone oxidoreductase subunit L [Burkholderiales bacterium]|nr:NADH-quinone oxidoreductase subunit L [Burkholderiales bacterium]